MDGGMHSKSATPFLSASLDEEDHHFEGRPVPEVQHKAKGNKEVHANGIAEALISKATVRAATAVEAATGLTSTSRGVFRDRHLSALQLKCVQGWICHHLLCAHVVDVVVGIHGKITLGLDVLGFITQEWREVAAGQVLWVADLLRSKTTIFRWWLGAVCASECWCHLAIWMLRGKGKGKAYGWGYGTCDAAGGPAITAAGKVGVRGMARVIVVVGLRV